MTYRFKLSRRLAVTHRALGVLGLVIWAGCGQPDSTDFLAPPPNVITSLAIAPKSASGAPGDVLQFTPTGQSRSGPVDVTGKVNWSTGDGATVAEDGRFTALIPGTFVVWARHKENAALSDSAVVTVEERLTVAAVVIAPKTVSLLPGEAIGFRAQAFMSNGRSTTEGLIFSAPQGGLVTADGVFHAPAAAGGPLMVIVQSGEMSDTALVSVTAAPPLLDQFFLNPGDVSVEPDSQRVFTVVALWSDGSTTPPAVSLSSTGGTITSTGLYTAGSTPGDYFVYAWQNGGGRRDSARVRIPAPTITRVTLSPKTASLLPGARLTYQAAATMSNGSVRPVGVAYNATGGSMTTSGIYTAGASLGDYQVIAVVPGVSAADTARVHIGDPGAPPQTVAILPRIVSTPAGIPVQFSATGTWPGGAQASPNVAFTSSGGTITQAGLFIGMTAGGYRVMATTPDGTVSDTATVTVTAGTLTGVVLAPGTATVVTGGSTAFSVTGVWSDGSSGAPTVVYSASGGSIAPTGVFTAGATTGTFQVIARTTDNRFADTSLVTVTAVPAVLLKVILYPDTVSLNPGGTKQFAVGAQWSAGGSGAPPVTYSAQGGSITAQGLYSAGPNLGTFRVIATATNGMADTSTVTILPATVSRVVLTPPTASVQTGGTVQFTATPTWSDGVSRPAPITFTATGGTITSTGQYTAGSVLGSFLVIAACSCGPADTSAVQVSNAPPPASTGSMAVTVSGLPSGTNAQISVSGPNSYVRAVVATTTLSALTNGSYTLNAGLVTSGIDVYTPAPISLTVNVASSPQATASVTYTKNPPGPPPGPTAAHPRLILDAAALAALRQKAATNEGSWTRLKATCDAYLTMPSQYPDGNAYAGLGSGYYGDNYRHAVANLGLCYLGLKVSNPGLAAQYGAKGAELLDRITAPAHAANPLADSGYGIRFYGVAMALGYDWLYDALSSPLRTQVYGEINRWVTAFQAGGYARTEPTDNYFVGYYAAQALGSLATEGDNPLAPTFWNDWLTRLHRQLVVPQFAQDVRGGGWPEGWSYGTLSVENYLLGVMAAKTAKGLDLVADGFAMPVEQAGHLIGLSWPGGASLDDRGQMQDASNPSATRPTLFTMLPYAQRMFNSAYAGTAQSFSTQVRQLNQSTWPTEEWQDALFWQAAAPLVDFRTLPLSYTAPGLGTAAVRSDWSNSAVWASFVSGPYVGPPGHPSFDKGSLTILKGTYGLLVNPHGWFLRAAPDAGPKPSIDVWTLLYNDDHGPGNPRQDYNLFLNGTAGQWSNGPGQTQTSLSNWEDAGAYARFRGSRIEGMYLSGAQISNWTRDVVFLRPNRFVVYDRTHVNVDADQRMHFHLGRGAVAVGPGRWDVTASGLGFVGSMITLLPVSARTNLVDVFSVGKVYRVEIRPPLGGPLAQRWLQIFDAGSSAGAVAQAIALTTQNGAIQSGNMLGTLLDSGASTEVVLFGQSIAPTVEAAPIQYQVPAKQSRHVVEDLQPNGTYTVTVTPAGANQTIRITTGGSLQATANGTLHFQVTAGGAISPGT
jgi:hypothetical protein